VVYFSVMQPKFRGMQPTVIIRHPKEKRSKCSLTPLEGRADLEYHRARPGFEFSAVGYTVLGLDAPVLSTADAERPLLLLDSTWRLLPDLEACLVGEPIRRSLPEVKTAYPRVSKLVPDPLGGLASVEALYLARLLLGQRDDSLLAEYYWREEFLANLAEL
jgi:pre-rRNA-processing protein TSR3